MNTYPKMNEEIKRLLVLDTENPLDIYAAARIEELEKQVSGLSSIIDSQKETNLALCGKVADLTAMANQLERLNRINVGIVDEYQKNIIPGFRERTEKVEANNKELIKALQDAINSPKGVVPDSCMGFYNPEGDYQ